MMRTISYSFLLLVVIFSCSSPSWAMEKSQLRLKEFFVKEGERTWNLALRRINNSLVDDPLHVTKLLRKALFTGFIPASFDDLLDEKGLPFLKDLFDSLLPNDLLTKLTDTYLNSKTPPTKEILFDIGLQTLTPELAEKMGSFGGVVQKLMKENDSWARERWINYAIYPAVCGSHRYEIGVGINVARNIIRGEADLAINLLSQDSLHPIVDHCLGRAYLRTKDYELAHEYLLSSMQKDFPESVPFLFLLAHRYESIDKDKALEIYSEIKARRYHRSSTDKLLLSVANLTAYRLRNFEAIKSKPSERAFQSLIMSTQKRLGD